jgi:hypothetical protein
VSFGLSRLRFETEAAFELVRARPPPYAPNPPPLAKVTRFCCALLEWLFKLHLCALCAESGG